jgi:hypothetical protein
MVVYEVLDGRQRALLDFGGGPLKSLRFRDDGRELWLANKDQIHRIDTRTWMETAAVRLRGDHSGSFIVKLAFDRQGRRCAASYALRRPGHFENTPAGYYWESAGGEVLVLDVASFQVTHGMSHPEWIHDVGLLSDGRVIGVTSPVFVTEPLPRLHPLFPRRDPSAQDWL